MRHESKVEIDFGYDVGEAAKDVIVDITRGRGVSDGVAFRIDVSYLGYGSFDCGEVKENAGPRAGTAVEDRDAEKEFRCERGRGCEGDAIKFGLEWDG